MNVFEKARAHGFEPILVPDGGYVELEGLDHFISTSRDDRETVHFMNFVFKQGIEEGASDIHFIHHIRGFRVRFRINGVLNDRWYIHSEAARNIDLLIRSRCMLRDSEREKPLDGSFFMTIAGRRIDIRVSILPNTLGESIVCRLLDQANAGRTLDSIWMTEPSRALLMRTLALEEGLILTVGPTGSGKTSTLYACLNYLNHDGINVVTAEDPVEYALPGANQIMVRNPDRSFALVLRAFLRHDFDVGLVGEIRDGETANVTMAAANTGHLMFSTLHTRSTLATITRLVDLGVKPYEIADSISLIVAQRLQKRLCPHCAIPHEISSDELTAIDNEESAERIDLTREFFVANPDGCEHCQEGFIGRIPIMEMLAGTRDLKQAIEKMDRQAMAECALKQPQYTPLLAAGIDMSAAKLIDFRLALKINL